MDKDKLIGKRISFIKNSNKNSNRKLPGLTSIKKYCHTISYMKSMEKMHITQNLYKIEKVF